MINPFIGIAGNIGVGKTTFTKRTALVFDLDPYYESVIDNPYLNDFYNNMNRWSFNLQIYYLHHRFQTHKDMNQGIKGVIQDRTIYEDVEIFAQNLYKMNLLNKRDWQNYCNLFNIMIPFLKKPNLIIYLRATTDTLITRIKGRNRDFENDISSEYLYKLNLLYEKWIESIKNQDVLIIETDSFNIYKDKNRFRKIINEIKSKLSKFNLSINIECFDKMYI